MSLDGESREGIAGHAVCELTNDERWKLVQRIVQDESFRRAPRLRELLLFVAERAISGHAVELNEYEIACSVFRRQQTFNSAEDSIVRSSVRQLRTKLHEYFEGPGRDEPLIIDIPKGSYVPEFPLRPPVPAPSVVPVLAAAPISTPNVTLWKRLALAFGLLAFVALGIAARTVFRNSAQTGGGLPHPTSLATWLFGGRGQEVAVVLCDSALVVVNSYRTHMLSLEDYIQERDQQRLPLPNGNPAGATPPDFPGKRLITSFRDMAFVERLSELAALRGFRVQLKHSRLMQVRDFRAGNYILLGSAWSNPWTTLFEDQLNFRFAEDPVTGSFGIVNTKPRSGEQLIYQCTPAQSHDGASYARIAVVPNLSGKESVLLVSGLHTESSEGALDAILSPSFFEEVRKLRHARSSEDLNRLELLLEVRAVDGVVRGTRMIASR